MITFLVKGTNNFKKIQDVIYLLYIFSIHIINMHYIIHE